MKMGCSSLMAFFCEALSLAETENKDVEGIRKIWRISYFWRNKISLIHVFSFEATGSNRMSSNNKICVKISQGLCGCWRIPSSSISLASTFIFTSKKCFLYNDNNTKIIMKIRCFWILVGCRSASPPCDFFAFWDCSSWLMIAVICISFDVLWIAGNILLNIFVWVWSAS